MLRATAYLTATGIGALTAGYEIIPAPGVGKFVSVIRTICVWRPGATVWRDGNDPRLSYGLVWDDDHTIVDSLVDIIDAPAGIRSAVPDAKQHAHAENAAVGLISDSNAIPDPATAPDGDLYVAVEYTIETLH